MTEPTTTVIVSDVHARLDSLRALLERIGVLDGSGVRRNGMRVVQLGDLVNLGYHVPERDFLEQVWGWFDVHLVGNHELPALQHPGVERTFGGWEHRDPAAAEFVAEHAREYRAATSVGPWLVTHAGVTSHHVADVAGPLGLDPLDASRAGELDDADVVAELAEALHVRFEAAVRAGTSIALVDAVGTARRGLDPHPGMFWTDLRELEADYLAHPQLALRQVVGHTPGKPPHELAGGRLWCIDTPGTEPESVGGVSALVTTDDGATWQSFWQPGDAR